MALPNLPQPYRLKWPLTASQIENADEMFELLFKRVRLVSDTAEAAIAAAAAASASGSTSAVGIPGMPGEDANGGFGLFVPPPDIRFTAGSVIFADASGRLAEDNAHFVWDDTNDLLTLIKSGIAAIDTDILYLANNTAATGGVPFQYSPGLRFVGSGWTGAASDTLEFQQHMRVSNAGTVNPLATLVFGWQRNGGGFSNAFTMDSDGNASVTKSLLSGTGGFIASAGGLIYFNTREVLASAADNKLQISNNATTSGFTIDTSTNGTLKLRNLADSANGSLVLKAATFDLGAVGAPALTFDGITTTGLYAINSVTLGLTFAGAEKIELASTYMWMLDNAATLYFGASATESIARSTGLLAANTKFGATAYRVGAVDGIDYTGPVTNFTATKGIVTAASSQGYLHHALGTTYISGTGTAGVDNTAQTVVTVAVAANTLTQVGDRLRIRSYWRGDTGTPITGATQLNGVPVATTTDAGAASFQVTECWLHYIDSTHANIIAMANGALDATISAANVAGFAWTASQNAIVTQSAVIANHIVVFAVIIDVFPKGY